MAKRIVTIESPPGSTLHIEVEADVVDKFLKAAQDKSSFKGRNETFHHALESAITVA
ncbi:MAG: hypothetical protein HYX90_07905 [Chloroflexi bacterium]|nr:hypothetical protein [Chloroflexota bacterium]